MSREPQWLFRKGGESDAEQDKRLLQWLEESRTVFQQRLDFVSSNINDPASKGVVNQAWKRMDRIRALLSELEETH